MTKKLEEEFNLPPIEDSKDEVRAELTMAPEEIQQVIATADKIDSALPQVTGLNSLDTDMDNYAQKAMDTFDDLVALGNNVEDRHAALILSLIHI